MELRAIELRPILWSLLSLSTQGDFRAHFLDSPCQAHREVPFLPKGFLPNIFGKERINICFSGSGLTLLSSSTSSID